MNEYFLNDLLEEAVDVMKEKVHPNASGEAVRILIRAVLEKKDIERKKFNVFLPALYTSGLVSKEQVRPPPPSSPLPSVTCDSVSMAYLLFSMISMTSWWMFLLSLTMLPPSSLPFILAAQSMISLFLCTYLTKITFLSRWTNSLWSSRCFLLSSRPSFACRPLPSFNAQVMKVLPRNSLFLVWKAALSVSWIPWKGTKLKKLLRRIKLLFWWVIPLYCTVLDWLWDPLFLVNRSNRGVPRPLYHSSLCFSYVRNRERSVWFPVYIFLLSAE